MVHGSLTASFGGTEGFAVTPDRVLTAANGAVHAYDRNLNPLWDQSVATFVPIGAPAVAGGLVYVGAGSDLVVLRASDGTVLKTVSLAGTLFEPTPSEGRVAVSSESTLYALAPQ